MVKISIIMPVYNGEEFLNKTINSVTQQTLKDIELICVDDGSTDNSIKVLENLNEKHKFIKIFKQENQGSGKARNTGMEKAIGEYIAFLDADDVFLNPKALEIMYNFAEDNDANIVSANLQFVEKNYSLKENWHYHNGDYAYCSSYDAISPNDYGIPYAFYKNIFKRSFLTEHNIKFPDLIRGQDPVFLAEVLANTTQVYTVPLYLYGYNYSIGGGVNVKVNTYEKKYSYMKHFKVTCDALEKGNLFTCSEDYKVHILNYLTWRDNIYDEELYEIYDEIFGQKNNYFDENDEKYIQFKIIHSYNSILKNRNDETFFKIKNELTNINYDKNDLFSKQLNNIKNSNNFNDLKQKYDLDPIKQWKFEEQSASKKNQLGTKYNSEEYRNMISKNREIIQKNRLTIKNNRELLSNDNIDSPKLIKQNKELINQNKKLIEQNKKLINN